MTPARAKAALKSLWTYNFTPDVGPWREAKKDGRWYALAGDGGLIMTTFPFEAERKFDGSGAWSARYFNECMSGFEHQVASHMMWEGMVLESLAVTRAIHDRYHGRLRNPYNEVECSDHYARAMASYGTFLGACGFEYDGPKGHIGFAPRLTPHDFRAAFTAAEGWGTFSQHAREDGLLVAIDLKWGQLRLRSVSLVGPEQLKSVRVTVDERPVRATHQVAEAVILVELDSEVVVKSGQRIEMLLAV
jgi:non-lysosomal glucosylceramidase